MTETIRVAACQTETHDDVEANLSRLSAAVREAADGGADLVVLPECALSGYLPARDLDLAALAAAEEQLVAGSREAGVWVVLGTTREAGGEWLNTARLYSPSGELVGQYDKTELTVGDAEVFAAGSTLPVFSMGEWTVGLQICFDMRFPENWRILRLKGAELVIHIANASREAAWKLPVLAGAMRSRAAENGMFVVSSNDARPPQMMVSGIYDPDGVALAEAEPDCEQIIFADLDRSQVKTDFVDARRTDLWGRPEHRALLLGE
jgi:predicted amidohydrolase